MSKREIIWYIICFLAGVILFFIFPKDSAPVIITPPIPTRYILNQNTNHGITCTTYGSTDNNIPSPICIKQ